MRLIARIADKSGALGSIVSAMSCPACFPALASIGSAVGLGFLSEYEGLFITRLLPLFAGLALLANALGWLSHRQWHRSVLGMIGPAIVLAAMVFFLGNWWTANLLYAGLAFMIGAAIWDLVSPAHRRCGPGGCAVPHMRTGDPANVIVTESVLICPHCGHASQETMPADSCRFFHECANCKAVLRPKPGDCCVFCSYGSVPCPPVQAQQWSCCADH